MASIYMSQQEVIYERIPFLKEQIDHSKNKPEEVNDIFFQLQIDAIRSADIEKVEFIILQKKGSIEEL
ncbi:MAG TPA: hypothetical protein VFR94_06210 [Nitrososphaeraceae archaeon]|nr:hypothetical protein [Nitrososphaeraceae archaeon]